MYVSKVDDRFLSFKVSINHGDLIRELLQLSTHAASKAELMAAITTTRYQQMRLRINPSKTVDDEEDFYDTPGLRTLSK